MAGPDYGQVFSWKPLCFPRHLPANSGTALSSWGQRGQRPARETGQFSSTFDCFNEPGERIANIRMSEAGVDTHSRAHHSFCNMYTECLWRDMHCSRNQEYNSDQNQNIPCSHEAYIHSSDSRVFYLRLIKTPSTKKVTLRKWAHTHAHTIFHVSSILKNSNGKGLLDKSRPQSLSSLGNNHYTN